MRRLALLTILLLGPVAGAEDQPSYPTGDSTQHHAGLEFHLRLPKDFDAEREYSLLVLLHGAGATGRSLATWYDLLLIEDFVICAPQAPQQFWTKPLVEKVGGLVGHLLETLPIGRERVHAAGFSNGGAHLPFLVFEPDLPFATACWMGSGYSGGRVSGTSRDRLWALALAGSLDPAFAVARATPKRLKDLVQKAFFLPQPGLAHEIPDDLIPFHYHWMRAREGRCHPGLDDSFPWVDDLTVAQEQLLEKPRPSLFYFFDERLPDEDDAVAQLQNEVFLDPGVQEFGRRILTAKIDVELEEEAFTALGFTRVPGVLVRNAEGEVIAKLEGRIETKDLRDALKQVAPR